jgi:hypothetical protein
MSAVQSFLGAVVSTMLMAGCVASQSVSQRQVFYPKPETPPAISYCFDTVGHVSGAKPFLLGGNCVCTPTAAVLKDYQAHGYFSGLSLDELIQMYRERGIQTALDHQGCNNLCQWGPHLVKGGSCMVPPTPGTTNYEEVISGHFSAPKAAVDKSKKTIKNK